MSCKPPNPNAAFDTERRHNRVMKASSAALLRALMSYHPRIVATLRNANPMEQSK